MLENLDSRNSKSANFVISGALHISYLDLENFRLQKVQKFRKIQNPEIKMANSVILDSQFSFHVKSE